MTAKPSKPSEKRLEIRLGKPADPELAGAMARMAIRPSVNAAAVMAEFLKVLGDQDIGAIADTLVDSVKDIHGGDMRQAEAMLFGQANALQAIFMSLARRAANQKYLTQWEANLRMALKAQNQCRMTLETLATLKNPPIVYARQANINNGGQQQVNNGQAPNGAMPTHAANSEIKQTELLESSDGDRLDTCTAGAAIRGYSTMATLGTVNRTTNN